MPDTTWQERADAQWKRIDGLASRLGFPTAEEVALLAARSEEHGFEFTIEHLRIEHAAERLEAQRRGRPRLTLIQGGRD